MANRIQSTVKAAERIGEFEEALGRAEETIRILEQEVARKSSVIDSLQQDLARLEAREQRANIAEELQSPV